VPPAPLAHRTGALVPVLVAMTLVVSVISSLGAPLLPAVASSLEVSVGAAQWSLTSALLAGAVAAPVLGRLGDGPWRREAILATLAIVCAGGVLAGLARSLPPLIAGRAMQGIGLGLAPIAMAAARDHLPADRSPGVVGLLSVSAAAGVGAGYPISGLIASQFDVFAAFLFGSVVSAAALALVFAFVPSSRGSGNMPLDIPGAALGSAGLVALLIGIGQGGEWGWGSAPTLAAFGLALILLAAWVRLQLRVAVPLVELRLLSHRAVLSGDGAALLIAIALYMFLTVVTGFVQAPPEGGFGFGGSTLTAGLVLVPFSVLSLATSRLMWRLTPLIGTRAIVVAGAAAIGAGGVFFALGHAALWEAYATMGLLGIGFGFTFAAIPGLISRAVPAEEAGSAMGFYQVVRSIGFSVGSATVASVLAAHEIGGSGFADEQGYVLAAWIGTGACVLAGLWAALLTPAAADAEPARLDPHARDDAEMAAAGLIDSGGETGERGGG